MPVAAATLSSLAICVRSWMLLSLSALMLSLGSSGPLSLLWGAGVASATGASAAGVSAAGASGADGALAVGAAGGGFRGGRAAGAAGGARVRCLFGGVVGRGEEYRCGGGRGCSL